MALPGVGWFETVGFDGLRAGGHRVPGHVFYLILAYFTLFSLIAEDSVPIPLSDAASPFAGMDEGAMGGGLYGLEYPGKAWNTRVWEPTTEDRGRRTEIGGPKAPTT